MKCPINISNNILTIASAWLVAAQCLVIIIMINGLAYIYCETRVQLDNFEKAKVIAKVYLLTVTLSLTLLIKVTSIWVPK